ncbi:MAG: bis-aminopropyl spermidine synthase family protein [Clostridia bacterium]|nr:bis-aminopropyl spermidine synthase family protein [Clostridia bacterium]
MQEYIKEIYSNVKIEEGEIAVENALVQVYFNEGISTKELARKLLLPVPLVVAIKKEFIKSGIFVQDRGIRLSNQGRKYVKECLGFDGLNIDLYRNLLDLDYDWETEFSKERELIERIFNDRPDVDVTIDQSKCTPETSLKRAILCARNNSLIGKKILCVGDDDLVSISTGLLLKKLFSKGRKGINTEIHVLDLDSRFLNYIKNVAGEEGLPIHCHHVDLRKPLDTNLLNQFDCFFTDPPYTLTGMGLFISRGVSALKKKKGLPIFFSFAHKSPDFTIKIMEEFLKMYLAVTEVIPRFNQYEGAQIIGNTSQMIILKTTAKSHGIIDDAYEKPIYTGEVVRTMRKYKCKQCGKNYMIGINGVYSTIEDLKKTQCSECRGDIFELIERVKVSHKSKKE